MLSKGQELDDKEQDIQSELMNEQELQAIKEELKEIDQQILIKPEEFCNYQKKAQLLSNKLQKHEEAVLVYDQFIQINPQHFQAYQEKAQLLRDDVQDFNGALFAYDQCIEINPYDFFSYYNKCLQLILLQGQILSHIEQHLEAIEVYNQFIRLDPSHFEAYKYKAEILLDKLQKNQEAIEVYDQFITLNPVHFKSYQLKAQILSDRLQKYQEAIQVYDQFIELNPKHFESYQQKANLLSNKQGKFQEAIKVYDQCIMLFPQEFISYYQKERLLKDKLNQYYEAEQVYNELIDLNQNDFRNCFDAGQFLENVNAQDKAYIAYKNCLKFNSNNFLCNQKIGILLSDFLGEYNEALYYFNCCQDIDPEEKLTYLKQGEALLELKQYFESKIKLEYYLKFKPQDEYAQSLLGKCNNPKLRNKGFH